MTSRPHVDRTLIALLVTALVAAMSVGTAEAKRFGGGKSFGFQGQKSSQTTSQRQSATDQKATRSPGAGMGGMLAGLAAGGLLAWLFMGGAFEGIQPMDLLVLVLLGVGVFLLIRHLRGGGRRPALAGIPGQGGAARDNSQQRESLFPQGGSGHGAPRPGSVMAELGFSGQASYQPPSWFDEERFLGAARTHFTNLQLAWDANRMDEVREFVTPDLFRELVRERAAIGDAENVTEVLGLDATLEDLGEEDGDIVASVRFVGRVREQAGSKPTALDETWLVRRNLADGNANWLIAGIRQNG
ncbi:MAG: Tim44 domain-containing protein [Pseudomonadota bacterium]